MPTVAVPTIDEPAGLFGRLANGVCRRAFSSPEAVAYELTIAPALADIVVPAIASYVVGSRVLDVGCGGGRVAVALAAQLPVTVVGVDPSSSQVNRLARHARATPAVTGIQAWGEGLPFADGTFDTVISSCAWKHWPAPAKGVAECLRVLRPGGAPVFVEIDGTSTPDEFWQFARESRIPFGMRKAYLRFAMRTVVGVAPDAGALEASFLECGAERPTVRRIAGMPFWLVTQG
jgi:ubiquinone/menaquinone biosynthesis C-methylase UbiE